MLRRSVYFIFSAMILSSVFAEASTAPKCSAVLMYQKSEIEAKVTAIVKTIAIHQMKLNQGLQGDQNAFNEATRQIKEITDNFPEMVQFYLAEMTRLSNKNSQITKKVQKIQEQENILDQSVKLEDSVEFLNINKKKNYIFKRKDGVYFVIGENKEFAEFLRNQKNIQQVFTTKDKSAIAILKKNGTVVTWGDKDLGGNSSGLHLRNVQSIVSTNYAFAALKKDGSVISWGGGLNDFVSISKPELTDVQSLYSTQGAFAALKKDGSVVTWGSKLSGAISSNLDLTNIQFIVSNNLAFAGLRKDGSVVTWGNEEGGGFSSHLDLTDVRSIYSTVDGFAALKFDGSVLTWGNTQISTNTVQQQLTNIQSMNSTYAAFAALTKENKVVSWGHKNWGGNSSHLDLTGVKSVFSTHFAFAVLKLDGSVLTWGSKDNGGDSSSVQKHLYNITHIIEIKSGSFLALRKDGKYILWGAAIGEYQNQVLDFDLM